MLCKVVVFCALIAVALAAQAMGPLPDKPEKFKDVEGCYIEELDEVVPFGEKAAARNSCMEYRCDRTTVTYTSCGSVVAGPGFELVQDKSKPYPDCCPEIVPITQNEPSV